MESHYLKNRYFPALLYEITCFKVKTHCSKGIQMGNVRSGICMGERKH